MLEGKHHVLEERDKTQPNNNTDFVPSGLGGPSTTAGPQFTVGVVLATGLAATTGLVVTPVDMHVDHAGDLGTDDVSKVLQPTTKELLVNSGASIVHKEDTFLKVKIAAGESEVASVKKIKNKYKKVARAVEGGNQNRLESVEKKRKGDEMEAEHVYVEKIKKSKLSDSVVIDEFAQSNEAGLSEQLRRSQ
jgi:hypothetical protein